MSPRRRTLPAHVAQFGCPTTDRRQFLTAAVVTGAGMALVIAGCGGDDSDADDADQPSTPAPSSTAASSTAPAAGGAFPVEIEGVEGAIAVERPPVRVVSVGQFRDTDAAVALGVIPVGSPDLTGFMDGGVSPWVVRELNGATFELIDGELSFEAVAALEPDLILGTDRSSLAEGYSQLSAIAPTLSTLNGYNKDPWQLTTERVGKALGKSDLVAGIVADVEAAVEAALAAHPELAGKTFTFGPVTADGIVNTINSTTDASVVFLAALGLELSPAVLDLPQAMFPGRAEISPERLDLLDADVIMLTFNTPAARTALEANPLFQALPAVQRGAYIPLELPVAIALGFPSALSIPYGLEELVPKLSAALA